MNKATARANANIALVKYWGKAHAQDNIPATPSLSMTLDGLSTTVTIKASAHKAHELLINQSPISGQALTRCEAFLENMRKRFGFNEYFTIASHSTIPYQAGLASSAAFYAALAKALVHFLQLQCSSEETSRLARLGSASAARSIWGGFAGLEGGDSCNHDSAHAFALHSKLDVTMCVAIIEDRAKHLSSREAMNQTQATSPYYAAFVSSAQRDFVEARKALSEGTFAKLGAIMEHSTQKMHACMWAAQPSISYMHPHSLRLINCIYDLRKTHGPIAFFTMDAGPNVKVLSESKHALLVRQTLLATQVVKDVRICTPGIGAHLIEQHLL